MQAQDFEDLYNLEERLWWFVAMRDITDRIVRQELQLEPLDILDAGCGTGYNIRHYDKPGHRVFSFDISQHAIAGVRKRGVTKVCQASVTQIPYRSEAFDLVFSFDVLEQMSLEDGLQATQEMHRVLKPGGNLFIRVPAFEWMRSSHDEELSTVHRYSRPEMLQMLRRAGFGIRLVSYGNTLLFPVAILKRTLKKFGIARGSDVKPLPGGLAWVAPILRNLLAAEAQVLSRGIGLPFGLSVIAYARKSGG